MSSLTTVWMISRTPTSTTISALKWAGGSKSATKLSPAWRDSRNAWDTNGDLQRPRIWKRSPSIPFARSHSIGSLVTGTTPNSTKWRCSLPCAPIAFPFPPKFDCSSTPTSTSSSSPHSLLLTSIPELVSHICSHLKDQETLGLEATEKCLRKYPANEALRQNQKLFQNRLKASPYTPLSHIALSVPVLSTH